MKGWGCTSTDSTRVADFLFFGEEWSETKILMQVYSESNPSELGNHKAMVALHKFITLALIYVCIFIFQSGNNFALFCSKLILAHSIACKWCQNIQNRKQKCVPSNPIIPTLPQWKLLTVCTYLSVHRCGYGYGYLWEKGNRSLMMCLCVQPHLHLRDLYYI